MLGFDTAIKAVEDAFKLLAEGKAVNTPRRRTMTQGAVLHVLQGAVLGEYNVAGLKAYLGTRRGARFVVLLFDIAGDLLAIVEADRLGQIRTGAASAVATKYMARRGSEILGVVGSGRQARAQFEALVRVIDAKLIKVYSKTKSHAEEFAEYIRRRGFDAVAVDSLDEASRVDVLATATNSKEPFIGARHISEGMHINAIGSNWRDRAELQPDAVHSADLIAVDDPLQAREEAGDLILADALDRAVPLAEVVAGRIEGRPHDRAVTIFKSLGIAVEDLVCAKAVYERALKGGAGRELPFSGRWPP